MGWLCQIIILSYDCVYRDSGVQRNCDILGGVEADELFYLWQTPTADRLRWDVVADAQ
jgi:hypothetical protein